jgi:hypothetical protein
MSKTTDFGQKNTSFWIVLTAVVGDMFPMNCSEALKGHDKGILKIYILLFNLKSCI